MGNAINRLNRLKKNSLDVTGKITVARGLKVKTLSTTKLGSIFNRTYCVQNSVICFVDSRRVFVTPFTRKKLADLIDAGFIRAEFDVPFADGSYPANDREKWHRMKLRASGSNCQDYERDCTEFCDRNGIGALKKATLSRCFMIPQAGVPVEYDGLKAIVLPACKELSVDCTVLSKLGTFCERNGRVVFVYRDGHTYVTRVAPIVDELREAGYRESLLSVPFSHDEIITDPRLAQKWAQT